MIDPFSYIRRKFAEATVAGINDGLKAVTPPGETVPADLDDLRQLVAGTVAPKALPPAKSDEDEGEKNRGSRKKPT